MKIIPFTMAAIFLSASVSDACLTSGKQTQTKAQIQKTLKLTRRTPAQALARFSDGHPKPSLESKLGNLLLEHKKDKVQIVLSLPFIIETSGYNPFGDGQTNAKMKLNSAWTQEGFPVVGIQTKSPDGKVERKYQFHPSLKISKYQETALDQKWIKIQPDGWKDSFYFSFETEVMPVSKFLSGIPAKYRTFSENRMAPDPERIGKGGGIERFLNKTLGAGYNSEVWVSDTVHGRYEKADGERTAIGGVKTWGIVDQKFGPFKQLYTCFDPRDVGAEKTYGVPSGAGWHRIGDAAETLLNNLESAALPVAVAKTHGQSQAAYGLTEVITATWMQTDQALVSKQGDFHWYLNPYENSVCTEIWVHNCVPSLSNNWGFNCNGT